MVFNNSSYLESFTILYREHIRLVLNKSESVKIADLMNELYGVEQPSIET